MTEKKGNQIGKPKKEEHPLKFMYPLCEKIYGWIERNGHADIFADEETLKRLYIDEDTEVLRKKEACKSIAGIIVVMCLAAVLTIVILCRNSPLIGEGGTLSRGVPGSGRQSYSLVVTDEENGEQQEVTVNVSEQKCDSAAAEDYWNQALAVLEKTVLGENASADEVSENLNLVDAIPGTPITVTWPEQDYSYVFSTGTIRKDRITEPTVITLTARLEYFDEVRLYSFPIRLIPVKEESRESTVKRLKEMLENEDKNSAGTPLFTLPDNIDGTPVKWTEKKSWDWTVPITLGVVSAVAIIPASREELKRRDKKRREEMLKDYPDIISKFILLITAGMTCRGAWSKICADYTKSGRSGRYAYDEMKVSERELYLGSSETGVYEDFGRRIGIRAYQRFGTLLANNLRRGSRDIVSLLELEAQEAFESRRGSVRQKAEEAGTKLLLPMMGMLCIVIAIVVVPAFSSFGG